MRSGFVAGVVAAMLAAVAGPALGATNLVMNGSFESGRYVPTAFTICECGIRPGSAAATAISGWAVVAPANALSNSGIDWLKNYPQYVPAPSDGSKNIDLSGDAPGAIRQSVATTSGTGYTLTFDVGSSDDTTVRSTAPHTLEVVAGPSDRTFSIPRSMSGYLHEMLHFTASSSSSPIEFISADSPPTGSGPVIDNVAVSVGGGSAAGRRRLRQRRLVDAHRCCR